MSIQFSVQPEEVRAFGTLVKRAGQDFSSASSYVVKNTEIDFSCAADIWTIVFGDHQQRVREAKEILGKIENVLDTSHAELERSAAYYQNTDTHEAERLDATYPRGSTSPGLGSRHAERPGTFLDTCDATSALKAVGGQGGWLHGHAGEFSFAPANKVLGTLLDLSSPSALVNEGLKLAFDVDILGQISNWLAGDWQSYTNCADAWGNLGTFCSDVSRNIRNGNVVLASGWIGNAADSAEVYFETFAKRLDSAKESFHSLREYYTEVARAIFSFAEFVKGAVAGILDAAIEAAVAAAASTAMAASGVGLAGTFVGGALAAERILSMVHKYAEIVKRYEHLMTVLNGMVGAGGTILAKTAHEIHSFPAAGGAYDNRAV